MGGMKPSEVAKDLNLITSSVRRAMGINGHEYSAIERFFKYVNQDGDCWEWVGAKYPTGYGRFQIYQKATYAHRAAWQLFRGDIPEDLCICHSCDNPGCVNPSHLFIGTQEDNARDREAKNRNIKPNNNRNGYRCKLTDSQVLDILSEYKSGKSTQLELASVYRVTYTSIRNIIHGKTWKHITENIK